MPSQRLPVVPAEALGVTHGANLGDSMTIADELVLDDGYQLAAGTDPQSLGVAIDWQGDFFVSSESALGSPGGRLFLDCVATFMPTSGATIEVLVLVEVDDENHIAQIYCAPLAPLAPKTDYVLVGIDRDKGHTRMAQLVAVSFTRGTRITTATGEQIPVEHLREGDRVLTRDDGPQEIRWIGHSTVRAAGEFAPIAITAGTLNNSDDLLLSPDHRLFIYQRSDQIGAGRSELLVKARHLVNGETVYPVEGGYVDYFQLMFDQHQIIFAEGISAETLTVDTRTRPVLPKELKHKLGQADASLRGKEIGHFEVHESLLDRPDAAALLKRASSK